MTLPPPDLHGGMTVDKRGRYRSTEDGYTEEMVRTLITAPLDAIREVVRISDRNHPAWGIVKAWLATQKD